MVFSTQLSVIQALIREHICKNNFNVDAIHQKTIDLFRSMLLLEVDIANKPSSCLQQFFALRARSLNGFEEPQLLDSMMARFQRGLYQTFFFCSTEAEKTENFQPDGQELPDQAAEESESELDEEEPEELYEAQDVIEPRKISVDEETLRKQWSTTEGLGSLFQEEERSAQLLSSKSLNTGIQ